MNHASWLLPAPPRPPTEFAVAHREGSARLLRFRLAADHGGDDAPRPSRGTLLIVPSLINRWYVLDLRPGRSVVEALTASGVDVWLLDWGGARDEDRHLRWDDILARLRRAVRRVRRATGGDPIAMLGYCMGGTLAAIHAGLHPEDVSALVNLAGPIDFSEGGELTRLVDRRWFDPAAVAAAGNIGASQMESGFSALRPTLPASKWVQWMDRWHDEAWREGFIALESWARDNVAFPAAAYETYIRALYQDNELMRGVHHVAGRRVDLQRYEGPALVICAERDTICPAAAATALLGLCGAPQAEKDVLMVPGGHIGAVVGSAAPRSMYPALTSWLHVHAT